MTNVTYERERILHDMARRIAEVVSSESVAGMRRVTLRSDDFATLNVAGPHDHVKLILPTSEGDLPRFITDESGRQRPEVGTVMRDMTVKCHGGETVVLDIVEHDGGPLIQWARTAVPGSPVIVGGPRSSQLPPHAPKVILGGDQSAFPALYRWLSVLDRETAVTVILNSCSADPAEYFSAVAPRDNLTILTLDNDADGSQTVALLESLDLDAETYAWFAGEATWLMKPRKWLRYESPLDISNVKVDGYWKKGTAGLDHHAPIDPSDPN